MANILHLDNLSLCSHRHCIASRSWSQIKIILYTTDYRIALGFYNKTSMTGWNNKFSNKQKRSCSLHERIAIWLMKCSKEETAYIHVARKVGHCTHNEREWACVWLNCKHSGNKPLVFRLTVGFVEISSVKFGLVIKVV